MAQQVTLVKMIFAGLLSSVCTTSFGQYQWKDDNGRMVYSDRPPPSSVLPSQMVKVPTPKPVVKPTDKANEKSTDLANAPKVADAKSGDAKSAVPIKSLADKDLESKKKAQEADQASSKKLADGEREARNNAACEDTRASLRTIESGVKVSRMNDKGEREVMSDDEKTKRTAALKKDLGEHCKAKG